MAETGAADFDGEEMTTTTNLIETVGVMDARWIYR
jgi:hypothetical protein